MDKRFADPFLEALTETQDLEKDALTLQASAARRIGRFLDGSPDFSRRDPKCQLLLVYCLYWWSAFARGYIFEVSIFRDLEASGIAYVAHDVTDRWERFSPYDLIVLDLRGDIKYTTYFISAETIGELTSDFFVTRLYDTRDNTWIKGIVMTVEAWRRIDGETEPTTLDEMASALPGPASIEVGLRRLIVMDYEAWKVRIRAIQKKGGT